MIRNYNRGGAYSPKVKAAIDVVKSVQHYDKKSAIAANACKVASLCRSATGTAEKRIAEATLARDHAMNTIQRFRRM